MLEKVSVIPRLARKSPKFFIFISFVRGDFVDQQRDGACNLREAFYYRRLLSTAEAREYRL